MSRMIRIKGEGRHTIRSKMVLSFSAIMAAALGTFLLLSLTYTRTAVYNNSESYIFQIIQQVNYDIDSYIDYMENISSVIAGGSYVPSYLFDDLSEEEMEDRKAQIYADFKTIMESREDIYNMAAVADSGRGVVNDAQTQFSDWIDVREQDWYKTAMESSDMITLSSSHVQNAIPTSYKWVITLSRALINNKTGQREGVFFVDLNYRAISNLCNNSELGKRGYIFILDENGNVVFHPKQNLIYGGLMKEDTGLIMDSEEECVVEGSGRDKKMYTISRSEKTGWTVVGVVYTSELLKKDNRTNLLYCGAAALLFILVVAVSHNIAKGITKPLEALKDSMLKVQEGDFHQTSTGNLPDNEIGVLSRSFNAMTERIHTLMEQNIYEQRQKRKNELKALQSQIKPHFLYNTLDSIIWMSEAGKNEDVVLMTSALARLLRQTIGNEEEIVSISEEIEYVRSYLTIQKMRYRDKMDYAIDIEPDIMQEKIFKFALQPLVENAIYHGLKYKETKGTLSIKGYRKDGLVCIEISDDGIGMDEETIGHLFEEKSKNESIRGVGVENVQKRIQLYYGEEYGLTYESKVGVGTKVMLSIPGKDEMGENASQQNQ